MGRDQVLRSAGERRQVEFCIPVHKDEGPVEGFEQIRLSANVGVHQGPRTRVEIGYLYRYEESRGSAANLSDHALHVQFLFTSNDRKVLRPKPSDSYL